MSRVEKNERVYPATPDPVESCLEWITVMEIAEWSLARD